MAHLNISTLITLVLFLGALATYLRGSITKCTIADLKESNGALKEKAEIQGTKIDKQEIRIKHLESENQVLKGVVTQSKEIASLTQLLAEHHTESVVLLGKIIAAVTK